MGMDQDQGANYPLPRSGQVSRGVQQQMKICIAGWYFRPQFLKDISISGYDAFVVKHQEGDTQGIPSALYENRGLEFGCYRQYLENHWDGESDVLFMHDD